MKIFRVAVTFGRRMNSTTIILFLQLIYTINCSVNEVYIAGKKALTNEENCKALGSKRELTAQEKIANAKLRQYKYEELDMGFIDESKLLSAQHFFRVQNQITESKVFRIIKMLPKASQLHGHVTALLSTKKIFTLIEKFTDNLYICIEKNSLKTMYFLQPDETCQWLLLKDWRDKNGTFDYYLKSKITLVVDNPEAAYKTQTDIWKQFEAIFSGLSGFLSYKPVFEAYLYEVLQEFYDDNVMYLEIRSGLSSLYDLHKGWYDRSETADIMKKIVEKFERTHKNFYGLRVIVSAHRNQENIGIRKRAQLAIDLAKKIPDFIVGFDLVGQEDKGKQLSDYLDILLEFSGQIKYFFHAGETNWNGYPVDENLYDVILLNSSRIGHGYAAFKHPEILKKIQEKRIPIEICPISNQVLMLVSDLRNHPANYHISQGHPIVIASDDPSFWGASGLSYDWYYAFMAMATRKADLRFLETLAINSIMASALSKEDKLDYLAKWREQWNTFIEAVVQLKL